MEREQFTFYRSWFKGLSLIKSKAARCDAYDAIINYALDNQPPDMDKLPDNAALAFIMARPIIDASRRKAEAGRKGGTAKPEANPKQTTSKPQAEAKQTGEARKQGQGQEKGQDKVQVKDKGQMSISPPPDGGGDIEPPPPQSRAVDAYMSRINPTPSSASMAELLEFERDLGSDVCVRAIDQALDANARSWSYVRAVLRAKQIQGIKSAEDWDRAEAQRMDARDRMTARKAREAETSAVDVGDLDWLLEQTKGADGNE